MPATAQPHVDERITRLTLQRIMRDFGELLAVTALDSHSFEITTPFSFGNGEMFPLVIEIREPGWRITDRGQVVATCARETRELSDQQMREVGEVARASGFTFSASHQIYADYDELPTPVQVARHIQIEAVVDHVLRERSRLELT